jgi:THUMP domain-like/RNA cap guanine-N2 methyltransferase
VSDAELLLSRPGQELLGVLADQDVTPGRALRLAEELHGRYPPDLVAAALTQQALRQAARDKFSRAADMLFTRAGLEQSSSELTAAHSARRFAGLRTVADLCCGIGGNLAALAGSARRVVAVDSDLTALLFAIRNASICHPAGRVAAVCADVMDLFGAGHDLTGSAVDAVYIDPARRVGERRLRPGESRPPLGWCIELAAQAGAVCIKAAPGLPRQLVPAGWETEFVAVGRDLKEALLWSPAFATTSRRATVLTGNAAVLTGNAAVLTGTQAAVLTGSAAVLTGDQDTATAGSDAPARVAGPGEYLLDPNPAVTRAGLVGELARQLGAWQIDPMIAFLSLDRQVSTPFARTLRVLDSMPWHEKQAARRLRELDVGSADIRRRGLAGDVAQIRRRLKLSGDKNATIVLTRLDGRPWGLICEDAGYSSDPSRSGPAG